ncbi:MAG: nucleotidyl transferase AbiEii/AbiGii toxin family protein [Candidatus Brocadiaceae bacterium]|nr:nucleotidyl transferase AbiEii/AbiGii toxin family protein [Candidatus Brocadiaceae bacterium]
MSKNKVHNYESELEASFDVVLDEADQLYEGHGRLKRTYEHLAKRLDELNVPYSLVGGYALILHGVRRFTEDIDLLVSNESLAKLHEELIGRGYVQVSPGSRNLRDAETGVRIEFVVTGEFPGDGKQKPIVFPDPQTVVEKIEGIKVVNLKSFIELKISSGMTAKDRLQDLADVQRLIKQHHLTSDFANQLHPYVRSKFLELL